MRRPEAASSSEILPATSDRVSVGDSSTECCAPAMFSVPYRPSAVVVDATPFDSERWSWARPDTDTDHCPGAASPLAVATTEDESLDVAVVDTKPVGSDSATAADFKADRVLEKVEIVACAELMFCCCAASWL